MTIQQRLNEMNDNELLDFYRDVKQSHEKVSEIKDRIEYEMQVRMDARGSNGIPHERYVCRLESKGNDYDQTALKPLKEIFNEDDLNQCWSPAWEKKVEIEEKFNVQKATAIAKNYGSQALNIIEKAKLPKGTRLVFREKKNGIETQTTP